MVQDLIIPGIEVIEQKARARGELLAICLSGSHAYGLNHKDSDYDLQGVYRSPTSQNLLLWGRPKETLHEANVDCPNCCGSGIDMPRVEAGDPRPVGNCPVCEGMGQLPDYTIHELFKFFSLAAGANPTVLEVMYLDPIISSSAWDLIVENRDAFLSTRIRATYGGYAKQQLAKKKRREEEGREGYGPKTRYRDDKHTRHIVRLFLQQRQLLTEGQIFPMLSDSDKDMVLLAQNWDYETLKKWMDEQTLQLLEINDNIPPAPDYERINELLLTLRGL